MHWGVYFSVCNQSAKHESRNIMFVPRSSKSHSQLLSKRVISTVGTNLWLNYGARFIVDCLGNPTHCSKKIFHLTICSLNNNIL